MLTPQEGTNSAAQGAAMRALHVTLRPEEPFSVTAAALRCETDPVCTPYADADEVRITAPVLCTVKRLAFYVLFSFYI